MLRIHRHRDALARSEYICKSCLASARCPPSLATYPFPGRNAPSVPQRRAYASSKRPATRKEILKLEELPLPGDAPLTNWGPSTFRLDGKPRTETPEEESQPKESKSKAKASSPKQPKPKKEASQSKKVDDSPAPSDLDPAKEASPSKKSPGNAADLSVDFATLTKGYSSQKLKRALRTRAMAEKRAERQAKKQLEAADRRSARAAQGVSKMHVQLWRETLDVLKSLQPPGTADVSSAAPTPSAPESGKKAKGKKAKAPPPAVVVTDAQKASEDQQVQKLAGALDLLKAMIYSSKPATVESAAVAPTMAKAATVESATVAPTMAKAATVESATVAPTMAKAATADTGSSFRPPGYLERGRPFSPSKFPGQPPPKAKPQPPPKATARVPAQVKHAQKAASRPTSAEPPPLRATPMALADKKAVIKTTVGNHQEFKAVRPEEIQPEVPRVSYNLDRVLFNPGVYQLQDEHSGVYNFDPYLASIMPIQQFDFNALKKYVTSSKDETLINVTKKHGKKYCGSTSSMTSMLAHFHFLLSAWRPINPANVSRSFQPESFNFTRIQRAPAAAFLHHRDGAYAIDADKQYDTANILSMLGKSMEKLLTLPKEAYERYRVNRSHEISQEERDEPEAFHYSTLGDFMMRSQLDAYDPRLPGTGMFDLKTRAVVSIRMDAKDFHKGVDYEITKRFGQWESFEREYYDMIRSAFLKYSLQVRMGRMDGIFVAFHNTRRIFGFQYIPVQEMDLALHGSKRRDTGDKEFVLSLKLLNELLNKATKKYPGKSLRIHIETRPSSSATFTYFFAKPVETHEIDAVQNASKLAIEQFEAEILGIKDSKDADAVAETEPVIEEEEETAVEEDVEDEDDVNQDQWSLEVWENIRTKVEEVMENEAHGESSIREDIEEALEQSGLLKARSSEEIQQYVDALYDAITSPDSAKYAETMHRDEARDEVEEQEEDIENLQEQDAEARKEVHIEPLLEDAGAQLADDFAPAAEQEDIEQEVTEAGESVEQEATEVEEAIEQEATEQEAVEQEVTEQEEVVEQETSESAEPVESVAETDTLGLKETEIAEAEALLENAFIDEDMDSQGAAPTDSTSSSVERANANNAPEPASLKDLILNMAKQVEANPTRNVAETGVVTDEDAEDSPLEPAQNKRFERILKQMMTTSDKTREEILQEEQAIDAVDATDAAPEAGPEAAAAAQAAAAESSDKKDPAAEPDVEPKSDELLGLVLTIRNKINSTFVERPQDLNCNDKWSVQYAIEEMNPTSASRIYSSMLHRRKELLRGTDQDMGDDVDPLTLSPSALRKKRWNTEFLQNLGRLSREGKKYRHFRNRMERSKPVRMYGSDEKLKWDEVFPHGAAEIEATEKHFKGHDKTKEEKELEKARKKAEKAERAERGDGGDGPGDGSGFVV